MTNNEYTVTQREAADFLNVSTKSISRYRKKGLPYKLILNPALGKQEVRFRYVDLERWNEGRQLLATYARDGEDPTNSEGKTGDGDDRQAKPGANQTFLTDLLAAYKEQIELLRDQLEDMREQLARRDRQIDDLMRLMVGLQLEYKPMPTEPAAHGAPVIEATQGKPDLPLQRESMELYQSIELPGHFPHTPSNETVRPTPPPQRPDPARQVFSREQLSASILRLRRKGKSFEEIARGLNQLKAATLSGQPQWSVAEVSSLLPPLVATDGARLSDETGF